MNCVRMSPDQRAVVWGNDEGEICAAALEGEPPRIRDQSRIDVGDWVMDLAPFWERNTIVAVKANGAVLALPLERVGAVRGPAAEVEGVARKYKRARLAACEATGSVAVWDCDEAKVSIVEGIGDSGNGTNVSNFEVRACPVGVRLDAHHFVHFVGRDGHRYVYNRFGQQLERAAVGEDAPVCAAYHPSLEHVWAVAGDRLISVYGGSDLPLYACELPQDCGDVTSLAFADGELLAAGTMKGQVLVFALHGLRDRSAAARAPILVRR